MERFIAAVLGVNAYMTSNLKSSMERFIDERTFDVKELKPI